MDHLQTRDGDESVQSHTNTAHDAGGNGVHEGHEGRQEGDGDGHESGGVDGDDGGVTRDGYATDRLTVGGVGATAEEGTCHRTHTVTQQGVVETGLLQKILLNDGGQVLVVGDMLGEDDQGHGGVGHGNGADVGAVNILEALDGLDEGELGERNDGLHTEVGEQVDQGIEVDDLQRVHTGEGTDDGEDGGQSVTGQDTHDEGDQADHLLTEGGAEHGNGQGDQTAEDSDVDGAGGSLEGVFFYGFTRCLVGHGINDQGDILTNVAVLIQHGVDLFGVSNGGNDVAVCIVVDGIAVGINGGVVGDGHGVTAGLDLGEIHGLQITDGVTGQGQTDDGNGGANDHGGHQLFDPLNANELDDECDQHVDQTGDDGTDDQTQVTGLSGNGTGKGGAHGANEGEGGTQEYGALEAGEEQVDQSTNTGAEQGGGGAHSGSACGHIAAGIDDDGNHQGGGHDGQQLLDSKDDNLTEPRLVIGAVDEFHVCSPYIYYI